PDDALAAQRAADHHPLDGLLLDGVTSGALADICPARLRSVTKSGAIHQRVVQDQIRVAEPVDRAQREQVGIAGACADQRDETSHATSRYSSLSARSSSGLRRARATPSAFQWVRSSCATSAQDSRSSGSSACSASRSKPASAGARPSVETATVTPPLRNTPPSQALAESVSSTALTNTPWISAAPATARLTCAVAAATNHVPSRSTGTNSRCSMRTPGRRSESRMAGATTVTRAPAAMSPPIFAEATLPPPTSKTERPCRCKKTGYESTDSSLRESHG